MSEVWLRLVERCVRGAEVVGSIPVTSMFIAGITQLVEYLTRNEEAEGSNPFSSLMKNIVKLIVVGI